MARKTRATPMPQKPPKKRLNLLRVASMIPYLWTKIGRKNVAEEHKAIIDEFVQKGYRYDQQGPVRGDCRAAKDPEVWDLYLRWAMNYWKGEYLHGVISKIYLAKLLVSYDRLRKKSRDEARGNNTASRKPKKNTKK